MLSLTAYLDSLPPRRRKVYVASFEFIKLQLAGNIPFWGTYGINFLLDKGLHVPPFYSLLIGTILAYALFFVVSDRWVFRSSRSMRRTSTGIWRFVIFMSVSALMTFNITWYLNQTFGVSIYIGQFISAGLSILWTFIGLKFWVFAPPRQKQTTRRKATRRKKSSSTSARR